MLRICMACTFSEIFFWGGGVGFKDNQKVTTICGSKLFRVFSVQESTSFKRPQLTRKFQSPLSGRFKTTQGRKSSTESKFITPPASPPAAGPGLHPEPLARPERESVAPGAELWREMRCVVSQMGKKHLRCLEGLSVGVHLFSLYKSACACKSVSSVCTCFDYVELCSNKVCFIVN